MLQNIAARLRNAHRMRSSVRELSALDDRMLSDIGITRAGIADAVRGVRR